MPSGIITTFLRMRRFWLGLRSQITRDQFELSNDSESRRRGGRCKICCKFLHLLDGAGQVDEPMDSRTDFPITFKTVVSTSKKQSGGQRTLKIRDEPLVTFTLKHREAVFSTSGLKKGTHAATVEFEGSSRYSRSSAKLEATEHQLTRSSSSRRTTRSANSFEGRGSSLLSSPSGSISSDSNLANTGANARSASRKNSLPRTRERTYPIRSRMDWRSMSSPSFSRG
jgi:hypothetical protein